MRIWVPALKSKRYVVGMVCIAAMVISLDAMAQEDAELNALQLADQTSIAPEVPGNWRIFAEAAPGGSIMRSSESYQPNQRLSLDIRYDATITPGWRAVFSDRLDINWPAQPPSGNTINTIKEMYLSWQAKSGLLFDAGRINERNGVALGYNPTDFFKLNAVRSFVSVDPASLKENRQGSVMSRAQKLGDDSSLSILFSPKLKSSENNAAFNPDFGSTNNKNRWLISYSKKLADGFNPQLLVFKTDQLPVQFGLNLTALFNEATVGYLEWAGGRSPSLLGQTLQQQGIYYADDTAFRQRVSTGVTYTTSNKISLTAELNYNGAGLDSSGWNALQQGSPLLYGVYRNGLQASQESPTKHSVFLYGAWQDAMINHLDLSAMARMNLVDSSRLSWLEARYHVSQVEFALQWQRYSGRATSEFGAASQIQSWALVGRYYFN